MDMYSDNAGPQGKKKVLAEWIDSFSSSHSDVILLSRGHFINSANIFVCQHWKRYNWYPMVGSQACC